MDPHDSAQSKVFIGVLGAAGVPGYRSHFKLDGYQSRLWG